MNNLRSPFANIFVILTCLFLLPTLDAGTPWRASAQRAVAERGRHSESAKVEPGTEATRGSKSALKSGGEVPAAGTTAATDYYRTGKAHYEAKRYKEAIDAFVQALRARPDDAGIHYELGMAYYGLSRYKEAAGAFERGVRLKPEWDEAHYRLGLAYYVLGKRAPSLEQQRILQRLNAQLAGVLARVLNIEGQTAATDKAAAAKTAGAEPSPAAASAGANGASAETVRVVLHPSSLMADAPTPQQAPGASSAAEDEQAKNGGVASANASAKETTEGAAPPTETYRLGVGDVLDIRLLDTKTEASSLYTVMANGALEYPLAGISLVATGMTTDELAVRLTAELQRRAISPNPRLSVSVRDYASHNVTLSGLVRNPGVRALRREAVPLYVVLTEAQPNPEAGRATILRNGQTTDVDLMDQSAVNTLVFPGDVIDVLARAPKFYFIGGQIQQPGKKVFQTGLTLMQAILTSGGVSRPGANNVVELSREGADGRLATTRISLKEIKSGKVPDPRLQPGDLIEVVQ